LRLGDSVLLVVLFPSVGIEIERFHRAFEVVVELHFERLLLVVEIALAGHAVFALMGIEQIRCAIPNVAQRIDVEFMAEIVFHDGNLAHSRRGVSYLGIPYSVVFQVLAEVFLVGVRHLNHHAGVLCKEHLHDVVVLRSEVMQVHVHTAFGVGKGHLEQRSDQSAGRNVMSGHHPSFLDKLLNGVEAVGKILRVLHRGHVAANLSECLGKGRATQSQFVEAEVDVV